MKQCDIKHGFPCPKNLLIGMFTLLLPSVGFSNPENTGLLAAIPVQMSMSAFIIIGALLVFSISMFFVFRTRFTHTDQELQDLASELSQTRQHLTQSKKNLAAAEAQLTTTTKDYQELLDDAQVGLFQMNAAGTCTYVNKAMQELSGLYPKKAFNEGLESTIHPDDLENFKQAWSTFVKKTDTFEHRFRFTHSRGRIVHVDCRANKVFDKKKKLEGYIGWITDVSVLQQEQLQQKLKVAHYAHFIDETVEGYFQLTPTAPIPLSNPPAQIAQTILETMTLATCNKTFSNLYATPCEKLIGKTITALPGGFDPLKNKKAVQQFIDADYKIINLETLHQDPRGTRQNLINSLVGVIENDHLVGIWGAYRNISHQKREQAKLSSQTQFMRHILDVLPADIYVKDTRCRYLYAGSKLVKRTGIPHEEWVGKTIFEVLPETARDHDKSAIQVMKNNARTRIERPFEVHGKSGWMETHQIPLVSNEGLVEGVVGLSIDITDRKTQEVDIRNQREQLDTQLKARNAELKEVQEEHGKTAIALRDATQKLRIRESELENHEAEFKDQLRERRRIEEDLLKNEKKLIARQEQLEEHLANRLEQLEKEIDKRKKWEELLAMKEADRQKLEEHAMVQSKQLKEAIARYEKTKDALTHNQSELEKYQQTLAEADQKYADEKADLNTQHKTKLQTEHRAHQQTKKQLKKITDQLQKTQIRLKELTEQQATEIKHAEAERKSYAHKLAQTTAELEEIKTQFNQRIEEETKVLKHELAQRQIREKALRQHEKNLETQIKNLEKNLQKKTKELNEQLRISQDTKKQHQQMEERIAQLQRQQKEALEHESQKLNLNIADIRLQEVKYNKTISALKRTQSELETAIKTRTTELEKANTEKTDLQAKLKAETLQRKTAARNLNDLQMAFEASQDNVTALIKEQTHELTQQVKQYQQEQTKLQKQEDQLKKEIVALKKTIQLSGKNAQEVSTKIEALKQAHATELKQLHAEQKEVRQKEKYYRALIQSSANAFLQVNPKTGKIRSANRAAAHLFGEKSATPLTHKTLDTLSPKQQPDQSLSTDIIKARLHNTLEKGQCNFEWLFKKADGETFHSLVSLSTIGAEKNRLILAVIQDISKIKQQQKLVQQTLEETRVINQMNGALVKEVNKTLQASLNPVVESVANIEAGGNLQPKQKHHLARINQNCRTLIDSMNYRSELSQIADGSNEIKLSKCNLREIIQHIDQQFCQRAETKKLFFAISYAQYQSPDTPPQLVETDEAKIHKILEILLGYALEHTQKGRIGLHAAHRPSSDKTLTITFELAYTGTAKEDDLLSRVFNPNADDPNTPEGMKYGLTLARRYAHLLDGKITLEYRPHGITALLFELPVKPASAEIILTDPPNEKAIGAA